LKILPYNTQVALRSKKAKLPKMEEQDSSTKEKVTSAAAKEEEDICYSTLTSFLQKDTSFLTPWSWDPHASEKESFISTKEKQYLQFQPGSYFCYSVSFRHLLVNGKNPTNKT